jgi:hypothetical protein
VPKGARGADVLQEVRDGARTCGRIVWETKNTKHWQPAWLDKLKHDQRAVGANLAVLVSTALPEGTVEFGRIDGVWVASLQAWPALALALREQLVQVAFAHAAADGKHEKMEFLYRWRGLPPITSTILQALRKHCYYCKRSVRSTFASWGSRSHSE